MPTMADAIEDKLQDLFIADSNLDDIDAFIRGEPITIPTDIDPVGIIFLATQLLSDEETGVWVYRYVGYVAVETLVTEEWAVTARKATVPSYPDMRNLLDALTNVLEVNISLDSISQGTESVRKITRIGDKVYGLRERETTIHNRGEVPFEIETAKPRTE